jgi:hypothetical protein
VARHLLASGALVTGAGAMKNGMGNGKATAIRLA